MMQKGWTNLSKSKHWNSEEKLHLICIKTFLTRALICWLWQQPRACAQGRWKARLLYIISAITIYWETIHFEAQSLPDVDMIQMWFLHIQLFSISLHGFDSPTVRSCKPPSAVKACGTTFHGQPDYLAGIKPLPFVFFEQIFVVFEHLHFPGIILRKMLNNQIPLFPCTS